jgi:hypothetical protein
MSDLNPIQKVVDRIAATDDEIMHATQEGVYLFFVVFLVDLELWRHSLVGPITGGILILLATYRILYYLAPYYLQRTVSRLPPEEKLALVTAQQNHSRDGVEAPLKGYLKLHAAERVADLLIRHNHEHVRKLAGLEQMTHGRS